MTRAEADVPFCALASAEAGEPLVATAAAETDRWIVLEERHGWAPKPLGSEGLAEPVRARLAAWLDDLPRARLQLIRRPDRCDGPLRLYLGRSGDAAPWLLAFDLGSHEELLELDVPEVLSSGSHPRAHVVRSPVHLVCTHGKRDRCCAKWGVPVHQALCRAAGVEHVWQTTHTGGHRFAANVISLPHGVTYGRLEPGEAEALVEAHRRGLLHDLARLRGRTCHDAPTQAAEHFVRERLGERRLEALRHLGTEPLGEARFRVRFGLDGVTHTIDVACEDTGQRRPKSCGDAPVPVERWRPLSP